MDNINPTHTIAWQELKKHFNMIRNIKMTDLFKIDKNRFTHFSINFANQMLVDYSKNLITKETINKLLALTKVCNLQGAINAMFNGDLINNTEKQSVLYIALRNRNNTFKINGKNIMPNINAVLTKMKNFCMQVINGYWHGYTGKVITDIVNIGIGGSCIGPYMVTEALRFYKNHLNIHFVSNIDGTHLIETIKHLNPETTIFLISSLTFLTQETINNACSARVWFLNSAKKQKYMKYHFIAISNNIKAVLEFGIDIDNIFELWNWICGRYSLWSAVGLPIALSIGFDNFEKLLHGAYSMDQHFATMPLDKNLPVLLAVISIWYTNFFGAETEAILPYDQYMHGFVSYIQQLNMESNGKYVDRNGCFINYQTGPIVWGGVGCDGQHSFYQLIHQGTKIIPCDFIAPIISHNPLGNHHIKLMSNFFAQTEALAFGKSKQTLKKELYCLGYTKKQIKHLLPCQVLLGNHPTTSILLKQITPYNLGSLISMYEHKVFSQGLILNINVFDQWGVQLGKQLADKIYIELSKKKIINTHDSSTNGLINYYKSWHN